jgi:hypothetical protein
VVHSSSGLGTPSQHRWPILSRSRRSDAVRVAQKTGGKDTPPGKSGTTGRRTRIGRPRWRREAWASSKAGQSVPKRIRRTEFSADTGETDSETDLAVSKRATYLPHAPSSCARRSNTPKLLRSIIPPRVNYSAASRRTRSFSLVLSSSPPAETPACRRVRDVRSRTHYQLYWIRATRPSKVIVSSTSAKLLPWAAGIVLNGTELHV